MPLNLRALSLTLILAGLVSLPAHAATEASSSSHFLLRGAEKWLERDRPDLAKGLLEKLILIEPASAEARFMLGNIELKNGNHEAALIHLRAMEQSAPDNPKTAEFRALYRIATGGQASTGKDAEAKAPTANPNELAAAIHDYETLAANPNVNIRRFQKDWRRNLHSLPDNAEKQAAIKRYLSVYPDDKEMIALLGDTQKNQTAGTAIAKQESVATNTSKPVAVPPEKASSAMLPETITPAKITTKPLQVTQASTKPTAKPARKSTTKPAPVEEKLDEADDPDVLKRTDALDAMDDGNLELAETMLMDVLGRRPTDPEVLGGLGMLKLRQGKHAEAQLWFERANIVTKGEITKWVSLIKTAQFWKNMRLANDMLDQQRYAEAEDAVQQGLIIQPDDPNGLVLLGNIKAAENDIDEAERLYRLVLKNEGYNVSAIRGLVSLMARTDRNDEALQLLEELHRQYPDEQDKNPGAQAGLLRQEAELYIAAHRPGQAMQALEMAVLLDPKDAWSRFSLAKLYISLNLEPLGKQIMQEGAALAPENNDMHYARALVLISLNDYAGGLESLSHIPDAQLSPSMRDTWNRALMHYFFQQAELRLAQGDRKEALRIMSIAETQARGNFSATEQVAEGWFKLGLQQQGINAMRMLPQPAPLDNRIYLASLLNRAKKDQELADFLPTIDIPEGDDATLQKHRATIRDIEFAMAGRYYDQLMAAKKTDEAQQFANSVLNANPLSNADYFRYHRNYFSRAELPADGIALLNREKEQYPDDPDIRLDLAYAYVQDKQNANALKELQELLGMTQGGDIDMRIRIAKLQRSAGDAQAARLTINDLTQRYPENTEVLMQAANLARSEGEYNQAMAYYQQVKSQPARPAKTATVQTEPPPDVLLSLLPETAALIKSGRSPQIAPASTFVNTKESTRIYRSAVATDSNSGKQLAGTSAAQAEEEMKSIEARRSAKIEAGFEQQSKQATDGTSTYNATEIPVRARFPIGYEAHGTVQIDKVDINAGELSPAFKNAALFGKIQAAQAVPAPPLTPKASGTSIGFGYEGSKIKADIGMVGIGFPVKNLVGGLRTGGDIGRFNYSLNFSRRPLTGSLLSYAGVRDPVSGVTWGGVTNTGVSLYMGTKFDNFDFSAVASYGLLRGKNVLNNTRKYLRLAVDRDVYASDNTVLNIGLNTNYTSYAKNEGFYTFGHGGYYSPQNTISIGMPIDLHGRIDNLSYQLVASMSYARTKDDDAAFYPTDPALQAIAAAGPLFPSGYNQPVYKGGSSKGSGYALRGAAEYRLTPNFALGGRFSLERSAYYAPNALLFYLRYLFNPETDPVKLYPVPVTPYSQY